MTMKRRFAFTLKIVCMFSMVFMLPSCENFFSGADAKHDIDAAVKFANAPTHDLRVFSETSETIPSGSMYKKVGEKFSVICKPFSDYEFIKWQVLHLNSNGVWVPYTTEEVEEVIAIGDCYNRESTFALKEEIPGLLIQPYCVPRPQVLSTFPYFEKTGILRDSRITVMFDQDISENSIYYDSPELKDELRASGIVPENYNVYFHKKTATLSDDEKVTAEELNATGIFDKLYIFYDANDEPDSIDSIIYDDRVYGYIACFDDGDGGKIYKTVYKNIQVSDRNKQNMLSYYRAPYFERPDILVVPAETGALTPAASSQILVTISMGIYANYREDGLEKPINLASNKKFNYYYYKFQITGCIFKCKSLLISSSLYFHLNTIGFKFSSSKYLIILSFNSSFEFTRIPLRSCLVILLKNPSTIFSQEPCFGVNTNSKRQPFVFRYFFVSFEV